MPRPTLARGLAASAVAALALTGLAVAPAHADSGLSVHLISQFTGKASTKQDSYGFLMTSSSPVTLTAKADAATSVSFSYRAAGADPAVPWTDIAVGLLPDTAGYATFDWPSPPGGTFDIRASATDRSTTVESTQAGVVVGAAADAVELNSTPLRYFAQPYESAGRISSLVKVSGTTSVTGGTVALAWLDANGGFHGQTDAVVRPVELKAAGPIGMGMPPVEGGEFSGILDIAAFDATSGATLAVTAERDSDDVQPLSLVRQTISGISIDFSAVTSTGASGTATVLDQDGQPIVGAQVRRSGDNSLVGYTGADGTLALQQAPDTTETYYANADDDATYDADRDVTADATSPAYIPVATTVVPEFGSGQDFRIGDYDQGDITLQVQDQEGSPLPGVEASYAVYRSGDPVPAATTATTDNDGVVTVAFDPATAGPGTYTLAYSAPGSTDLTDQATFTVEADPVATTVVPQFADGHVFDTDEYAAGDISLQIKDQYGDEFSDAGAEIAYSLYRAGDAPDAAIVTTTDRGGRIDVPFDPTHPGTYTLAYGDLGSTTADHTVTFTVGQASLSLTPASGSAASGGAITYTGILALGEDPLPGRAIDLTYTTDADGTSGLGADRDATATAVTDAHGAFTVTVQDGAAAAPGSPVEIGTLTAATADNVVGLDSTLTGNANESASATVRFVAASLPPAPSGSGGGTAPSPSPTPTTTPTPKPTPTPTPKPTPGPTPAAPAPIHLSGSGDKGAEDRLRIVVSPDFAGRKVVLRRLVHGHWVRTASGRIDAHGVLVLDVRDRNHGRPTTYKVTLLPDASHSKSTSNVVTLS